MLSIKKLTSLPCILLLFTLLTSCGGDSSSEVAYIIPASHLGIPLTVPIAGPEAPELDQAGEMDGNLPILLGNYNYYFADLLFLEQNNSSTQVSKKDLLECQEVIKTGANNYSIRVCATGKLAMIGQITTSPSIDEIMSRVVYSAPWMAERFRNMLLIQPKQVLKLFGALTSIFLLEDTRPSFYISSNSSLYLDPHFLAVTEEELESLPEIEDFRSDFGYQLNFLRLFRYRVTDDRWPNNLETNSQLRASLTLYHELGHANSFYPYLSSNNFPDISLMPVIEHIATNTIADDLFNEHPLLNETLKGIADVMFRGETPSEELQAIGPQQVFDEFITEGAIDIYNYSNRNEDLAMLFEETAAYYFLGLERFNGFFEFVDMPDCDNLQLIAGTQNRLSSPLVQPRVKFVFNRIFSGLSENLDTLLDEFSEEGFILDKTSWCSLP